MEGKDASEIAGYLTGAGVLDAGKHATLCGKARHTREPRLGLQKLIGRARYRMRWPIGKSARCCVQQLSRKYSAFVLTQISRIAPPVPRRMGGVGHRHDGGGRGGGR